MMLRGEGLFLVSFLRLVGLNITDFVLLLVLPSLPFLSCFVFLQAQCSSSINVR